MHSTASAGGADRGAAAEPLPGCDAHALSLLPGRQGRQHAVCVLLQRRAARHPACQQVRAARETGSAALDHRQRLGRLDASQEQRVGCFPGPARGTAAPEIVPPSFRREPFQNTARQAFQRGKLDSGDARLGRVFQQ